MKKAEKKDPVQTMPKGVWESSRPQKQKSTIGSETMDMQGNGYPKPSGEQKRCDGSSVG